ncbi:MAG: hypothetical protein U0172_02555 [Nitrospiraceae bacterium]
MTPYRGYAMRIAAAMACAVGLLSLVPAVEAQDRDEPFIFAVITKPPKDKTAITAQVLFEDKVSEATLFPVDAVVGNPIWRTLEICHSIRAEVRKLAEGYQIVGARVLDASMLPMSLQSIAGDCLIKKAVEVAPLVD